MQLHSGGDAHGARRPPAGGGRGGAPRGAPYGKYVKKYAFLYDFIWFDFPKNRKIQNFMKIRTFSQKHQYNEVWGFRFSWFLILFHWESAKKRRIQNFPKSKIFRKSVAGPATQRSMIGADRSLHYSLLHPRAYGDGRHRQAEYSGPAALLIRPNEGVAEQDHNKKNIYIYIYISKAVRA